MTMVKTNYLVLSYYYFTPIDQPEVELNSHKNFVKNRDVSGRIYISSEGINGQMSGSSKDCREYMDWMNQHPLFASMDFRITKHSENIFPKMTVKIRDQLVALDRKIDFKNRGKYLTPKEWKEALESDADHLLIDVRNDYEWEIGHFDKAELPRYKTFREFNDYVKQLKKKPKAEKQKIMMYCTGGIRCELYSSFLKEKGFEDVYQLQGGVINYGLNEGNKHWLGNLFVFDDRLSVPICEEKGTTIGHCHHCQTSNDDYFNCANMDCNELFLCCGDCLEKYQGCCQKSCMTAKRVRPFDQVLNKPFRKWYHYYQSKDVKSASKRD